MSVPPVLRSAQATVALGAVLLLVVAAGGWFLVVGPASGSLGTARTELSDARDANGRLAVRMRRLEQQQSALPEVRLAADELATLFPPTADQPGFFQQVDRAAQLAGIRPRQVTSLSPGTPVPWEPDAAAEGDEPGADPGAGAADGDSPPELAVQAVAITVEATYPQARVMVAALERMERSLLISSLSVAVGEDGRTAVVTITGSAFVAPPLGEAPAVD